MEITDAQYRHIEPCLPRPRGNVTLDNLHVLNAILYVTEQGCKWRGLPKRFGNWHTIYTRMNRWSKSGVLDRVFAQLQHTEIFGPILAVMKASSYQDALTLANSTPYALTGGVYSRSPAHLELARQRFDVGNLYLNRPITGALVGRQPFGGHRLSGVGAKAGGEEYLMQFVVNRVVSEQTLRRGFAPPE
ncbi:MAG: aldehyde dehydrogenase family protein [Nitrospira sp. CG24A]|nr:MAG: aldehyde dehydrogenase family protein [Nitrospira sp. CG24A]